jgi:hypothetical protein
MPRRCSHTDVSSPLYLNPKQKGTLSDVPSILMLLNRIEWVGSGDAVCYRPKISQLSGERFGIRYFLRLYAPILNDCGWQFKCVKASKVGLETTR